MSESSQPPGEEYLCLAVGPYLGEAGFGVFRLQGLGAERLRVSSLFFWVGVVHDLFQGF